MLFGLYSLPRSFKKPGLSGPLVPLKRNPTDGGHMRLVSLQKGLHDLRIETLDDVPCLNRAGDGKIGGARSLLDPAIKYCNEM